MRRATLGSMLLLTLMGLATGEHTHAAAPAAPSYLAVERAIAKVRDGLAKPSDTGKPTTSGWNQLFDAILNDLKAYSEASDENGRLVALNHLHEISIALSTTPWPAALDVRETLRGWLRPRVRLANAERRVIDALKALPPAATPEAEANRKLWVEFVTNEVGKAIKEYEAATTVAKKRDGLKELIAKRKELETRNQSAPWSPALDLQAAIVELYDQPNIDVSVDLQTLSPTINTNLITSGPVFRKGYWSQVTAGQKTGFGLLSSDYGIAFYNSQMFTSVTPITDFQKQVEADPRGRRGARLYQFNATTIDKPELTITVIFTPAGIQIIPSYKHAADAIIKTTPQPCSTLGRTAGSIAGFDQAKIEKLAYDNAIGKIRSNIETEAMEEGLERTSKQAAERNAQLAKFLIGNNRFLTRNLLIEQLSLRSRPQNALIGGKYQYLNGELQTGSDTPQPASLATPDSGISADLHVNSLLNNFVSGAYKSEGVTKLENFMIVAKNASPGAPPSERAKVSRNVDFPTYMKELDAANQVKDEKEKVQVLRIKRPERAPEFGVDTKGNLVVLIHDLQLDLPTPPAAAKGGIAGPPAKLYRVIAPDAELAISFKILPGQPGERLRLVGKIEEFELGASTKVLAINDDEAQAKTLTRFTSTFVLGILRSRIQGQPLDFVLPEIPVQGLALRSVSDLDPSGWIRVTLDRTGEKVSLGTQ